MISPIKYNFSDIRKTYSVLLMKGNGLTKIIVDNINGIFVRIKSSKGVMCSYCTIWSQI